MFFQRGVVTLLGICLGAGAASTASAEVKVDFNAYARSGIQVGARGETGEPLYTGFATHNRLQETSYFELSATAHAPSDSSFVLTVGNGDNYPHYNGEWPGPGFAVRNAYFELEKLPDAPDSSAWFGSRMYRGSDIYLFDTWPIDNENMLGGGIAFNNRPVPFEFAFGAKMDATYEAASKDVGTLQTGSAQRYFLINKVEWPVGGKKLKTNLELHYIPHASLQFTPSGTGAVAQNVEAPMGRGEMISAQYPIWGANNVFARFGAGDVAAGSFQTPASAVPDVAGLVTREGSKAAGLGLSNAMELESFNSGVMYALIAERIMPKGSDGGTSVSSAVRPMYYITAHWHGGLELDGVHYFKQLSDSDADYLEFSPMLEYALNKNIYGSPKFRLIASEAFYSREVPRYGEAVRSAFNVGLGFELWF